MTSSILESPRPLAESSIWNRLYSFYQESGLDAWRKDDVPQGVTSNAYMANGHARIVVAFLKDCARSDPDGPTPLILEVGGGSGLFAWFLMHRLRNQPGGPSSVPPFEYLVTDAAPSNVAEWAEQPRLGDLIREGALKTGVLRIGSDLTIQTSQGRITEDELLSRPLLIVANYVFDSVPSDMIRIEAGKVFRQHVGLETTGTDEDRKGFGWIEPTYEDEPLEHPYYSLPDVNAVVDGYCSGGTEGFIPVPVVAMDFLQPLLRSPFPLAVLVADLGYTTPDFEAESPLILRHFIACPFNFHMVGKVFEAHGGWAQFSQIPERTFTVGGFFRGSPNNTLDLTRELAQHGLAEFTPFDTYNLTRVMAGGTEELDFASIVAWLRFSSFDPFYARHCIAPLLRVVQDPDAYQAEVLVRVLDEALAVEYPGLYDDALDHQVVLVLVHAKLYEHVVRVMESAAGEFGRSLHRLHFLGLGHLRTGRKVEAEAAFREMMVAQPGYWDASMGRADDPSETIVKLLNEEDDTVFLDHLALMASVEAFAQMSTTEDPS